jgi:hypothetical protein
MESGLKNRSKFLKAKCNIAVIAMVAIVGLSMAACDNDTTGGGGGSGGFNVVLAGTVWQDNTTFAPLVTQIRFINETIFESWSGFTGSLEIDERGTYRRNVNTIVLTYTEVFNEYGGSQVGGTDTFTLTSNNTAELVWHGITFKLTRIP